MADPVSQTTRRIPWWLMGMSLLSIIAGGAMVMDHPQWASGAGAGYALGWLMAALQWSNR